MKKPDVCVLRTDGINCDEETFYAFELAGGKSRMVHVNQLRSQETNLGEYQILVLPGGFSYGDDVHSGKVLAVELASFLKEQMLTFVEAGKLIIGICNGFQVLVRTGLLPNNQPGRIDAALMANNSGRFECRWVKLLAEPSNCIFTRGLAGRILDLQVAHGEGKLYGDPQLIQKIEQQQQVVFRYASETGQSTETYPANPNGSVNAIAGVCDPTGRIMGLMPHPERYVTRTQYHNWRQRSAATPPHGLAIFQNAIAYAKQN